MQIKSQSGAVVIDYYPTKTRSNVKLHDKVLKILTLNGKTFLKKVISTENYINDVSVSYTHLTLPTKRIV